MAVFENCIFDSCEAETHNHKGGAGFIGGENPLQDPQVTCRSCRFTHNRSGMGYDGGALAAMDGELLLDRCTFAENVSRQGGALSLAAAIHATITNCTFSGNRCRWGGRGGALYIAGGRELDVSLENTVVAFSTYGEGITCEDLGGLAVKLECCDVYGNANGDWVGYIADQRGLDGNFSGDPGFCDTLNGNFTIRASSPCMPDDLLGCGLIGAHDWGCPVDTLVVDPQGGGDYPTIQVALDSCSAWGVVTLEDGIYTGEGNRDITVPARAMTICSRGGDPSACLLNCQGSALDPHRAFRFSGGVGQESMLRGVGVTGGDAGEEEPGGGAIYCSGGSPRVAGCLLYRNDGEAAGGALFSVNSSPALIRCTLSGNEASQGAGVYASGSGRVTLQNSIVSFSSRGEAVACSGSADAVLSCCCVYGNAGGDWVGCIAGQVIERWNFCDDPCFCDEGLDDYFFMSDSRCAGEWFDCGVIGAMPVGCGAGCVLQSARDRIEDQIERSLSCLVANPFLPGSQIVYSIPRSAGELHVVLAVHDATGRLVRWLVDDLQTSGEYRILRDGTDRRDQPVPAGMYFCRLRMEREAVISPVLLVR